MFDLFFLINFYWDFREHQRVEANCSVVTVKVNLVERIVEVRRRGGGRRRGR